MRSRTVRNVPFKPGNCRRRAMLPSDEACSAPRISRNAVSVWSSTEFRLTRIVSSIGSFIACGKRPTNSPAPTCCNNASILGRSPADAEAGQNSASRATPKTTGTPQGETKATPAAPASKAASNNLRLKGKDEFFIAHSELFHHIDQHCGAGLDCRTRPGRPFSIEHGAINRLDLGDGTRLGTATDRGVANDLPPGIEIGCDMGEYPVKTAILGHVLDVPEEFLACLNGVPGQLEGCTRHIGMANDVVLRTEQFFLGITGELDKNRVAIGNDAFGVGLGNDEIVFPHFALVAGRLNRSFHGHLRIQVNLLQMSFM